jgi:hypothetical protein
MRKNRTFVIIGAGVILFLLISNSAIAGLISTYKTYEMLKDKNSINSEKETYIDPDIYLTTKHLFLLKISVPNIENKDVRELTQKIINIIQKEGSVDSEQIRQIISDSDYKLGGVYFDSIIGGSFEGAALPLPFGMIRSALLIFFSKGGLMWWETENSPHWVDVNVGGDHYTTEHTGWALGFFGIVSNKGIGEFPNVGIAGGFFGYALFVVVI